MKALDPKCITSDQQICLNSQGYFTPCCWVDNIELRNDPWIKILFREHLKLENNKDVDDIFNSKEWETFFKMLLKTPQRAPDICKKMCGSKLITEQLLERDTQDNTDINVRIRH